MGLAFYKERVPGDKLPHRSIPTSTFLIVERAICVTWNLMRTNPRPGFDLINAHEDKVTHELYERLCDEVYNKGIVSGFNRQLFMIPVREPNVRNYNGASLDKMPDLRIQLFDLNVFMPSQDGIFVECKPVDTDHSAGGHYCKKGIIRFVCGDYAWAMTSALMVGYVRNGYYIKSNLVKALKKFEKEVLAITLPYPCPQSKPGTNNEVVHFSNHARIFKYVGTGQQAPAITLRHLWLRRD